jgi:predicted secreted protein
LSLNLRIGLAVAALCTFLGTGAPAAIAETTLHLAETATVMAAPDEIAAVLRAEAAGPAAPEAQARVNATMQDALERASHVSGITTSTGGYSVWRTGPNAQDRAERWQVSQTLHLTGQDGPALLGLVGDLQRRGLVVGNLAWRLSRSAERKARMDATRRALAALRGRVEEAAGLLDLRFSQFKDVRLDNAAPPVFRALAAPMAMSAAAPAPPTAAAEDVPVSATAEADAILQPR